MGGHDAGGAGQIQRTFGREQRDRIEGGVSSAPSTIKLLHAGVEGYDNAYAKITKLGETLTNDALRASYVSIVSDRDSRGSFDDLCRVNAFVRPRLLTVGTSG